MTTSWLADKIQQWPVAKLIPYARNARTHSDEQVAQIAASIAEFGFTNPILVGADGVIVAGHGRLAAAQKLAMAMVPVVVLEHLSPTQRRALVIADNRIAENAGWDETMLRVEMEALQLDDFDMSLTGFDADALAELMAGGGGDDLGNTDDDDVPEVLETAISRTGDVWLLGPHRLLCGDSTLEESYAQLLQGEEVDMVFTDPPYNVNYANTAKDKMRGKNRAILNDNLGDGFYDFLLAALTPTVANCKGAIYVAMSSSELDVLQSAFREAGVPCRVAVELNSVAGLVALSECGGPPTILPKLGVSSTKVTAIRLEQPTLTRKICLLRATRQAPIRAREVFADSLRKLVKAGRSL